MTKPFVDRIPFLKILIASASLLALSVGLFGMSIALIWRGKSVPPEMDRLMNKLAGYDVLAMVLSGGALLLTAILWVALTLMTSFSRKR